MMILKQNKGPNTQQAILMSIYAFTDGHTEKKYKGHNECCGAQIVEIIQYCIFKKIHKRAIYYPITQLCINGLIEESNRDTEHESHVNGFGQRRFFKLTKTGTMQAEVLWEQFSHLYSPEFCPI